MATELIGVSPQIIKIRKLIDRIADTGINVIICGETGVGKEVVVSLLYRKSDRRHRPFVKVNRAALSGNPCNSYCSSIGKIVSLNRYIIDINTRSVLIQ